MSLIKNCTASVDDPAFTALYAATYLLGDHGNGTAGEMQSLIASLAHQGRLWYQPFLSPTGIIHKSRIFRRDLYRHRDAVRGPKSRHSNGAMSPEHRTNSP